MFALKFVSDEEAAAFRRVLAEAVDLIHDVRRGQLIELEHYSSTTRAHPTAPPLYALPQPHGTAPPPYVPPEVAVVHTDPDGQSRGVR